MAKQISQGKFAKNVIASLTVQIVSMAVSFILTLVVPKFIDEFQYAYWQKYVLYVNYVGILHFGILDGIVLRFSQYDYDEIDKKRVRSIFMGMLVILSIFAAGFFGFSNIFLKEQDKWIFSLVAVGIISKNVFTYATYTFQITNRINGYAALVILLRVLYGITVVVLLVLRVNNFFYYCLADISADFLSVALTSFLNKGMYFGKGIGFKDTLSEIKVNLSAGINLVVANWAGMFIVGGAKMVTEWRWGSLTFGKVAFTFSVSNVFLTFISAVSIVLFPSLKRIDESKLPELYKKIRGILSPLLILALWAYFPGCSVLSKWLPKYNESLFYLGMLLPIIVYSSKINLLTNNYLKAYRKERVLLIVNILSFILFVLVAAFASFVFEKVEVLILGTVGVMAFSSLSAEFAVMKTCRIKVIAPVIFEAAMVVGFILCATLFERLYGFLIYGALLAVYFAVSFKQIKNSLKKSKA